MTYPRSAGIGVGGVFVLAVAAAAFTSASPGPQDHVLTRAEAIGQFTEANPRAAFYEQGNRITRIYGQSFSHGVDAIDSAEQFVQNHARLFGVAAADLFPEGPFLDGRFVQPIMYDRLEDEYRFTGVYYTQTEGGIPVFRSRLTLLVRNEAGYPLVLAGADLRDLGGFSVDAKAAARVNMAKAQRPAQAQLGAEAELTAPALVIWAGVDDMVVQPRLAVQYIASTGSAANPQTYQKWLFLVDAQTGAILYQEDQILHADVVGNVSGMATEGIGADICDPETLQAMPYARVSVGGTVVFADENGFYSHDPGASPVTVTSTIRGRWFRVENQAGGNASLSQSGNPPGTVDFLHNASNSSELNRAEVNGYVQANVVRDFTLSFNPSFPTIANQTDWPVNVNLNSNCNAFYDFSSINFYTSGGGCSNTANATVVHHEYGHHLVAVAGSGQGAYGEGLGDVMGVLITDQPILGLGFSNNCNSGLRNADNNVQYPCAGAIHACGRLLSGCVWSTRNELLATNPDTYSEIISNLAVNSILLHSGSGIAPSITIDFLTLDDDDDDIFNGTPHYAEIATGFGDHNMDAPELALLQFSFPDGLPEIVTPSGGTSVAVEVLANTQDPEPGTGVLHVDTGDGFVEFPMDQGEPNVYVAVFPASDCGSELDYFFSAETTEGVQVNVPSTGSFSALSGSDLIVAFEDDFEAELGWSTTSNASTGAWQRGVPAGGGDRGDPPTDADGSGKCYVTGIADGDNDIDDGSVTLTSPNMDASADGAVISYWRWYSNTFGNAPFLDIFVVEVSDDGGASWVNLETVGPAGPEVDGGWFQKQFLVSDFVDLTDEFRIRFTASDLGDGSVVEAGVDGVRLSSIICDDTATTPPDGFEAFRGFHDSGDLGDLLDSDDNDLCHEPGIVLDPSEAPITLDFTGTLPNDSPATLDVTIESSANTIGLELTFSFWNYNTNSWDIVGTDTQSLDADTVRTFAGNPADHVEAGTGEVRTRYEVRVVSPIFLFPWLDCVDHVFWSTG